MNAKNYRKLLPGGYTNKTFLVCENGKFSIEQVKNYNGFNHNINYKLLNKFSFVPKFLFENDEILKWDYIDQKKTVKTEKNILIIAKILKEIHTSKLKFPNDNIIDRQKIYLKTAKRINKESMPKEIHDLWDFSMEMYKKLGNDTPIHYDPWMNNFIGNAPNEIYLVDWEFAVMGDIHWDLSYFIDSSLLSASEKELFLDNYGDYDEKKLAIASFLVNFVSIVWIFQFKNYKNIFPFEPLLEKVIRLHSIISLY